MKRFEFCALFGLILLVLFLTFFRLSEGSIHNSDDALYAQVIREVATLHHYDPLTFSGNPFTAKPALPFWLGSFFVQLFGDHDSSYRLLSAFSLLGFFACAYVFFWRKSSWWASWIGVLCILSSPLCALFARRVMLELPLSLVYLFVLALTYESLSNPRKLWLAAFFVGLGWWTKETAILPALAASLTFIAILKPKTFLHPTFWMGAAFFALLIYLRSLSGGPWIHWTPASWSPIHTQPLLQPKPALLYLQTLRAEGLVIWLIPLSLILSAKWLLKNPALLILALGTFFGFLAPCFITFPLPHYLLPGILVGFVFVGLTLGTFLARKILIHAVLIALVFQLADTRAPWLDPASPDLDPAAATKALALESGRKIPLNRPLCVVDAYFVGFRYYSKRETLGILTSTNAFERHSRVKEFQNLVISTSPEQMADILKTQCGGYAILPTPWIQKLPPNEVVAVYEPLALIQLH